MTPCDRCLFRSGAPGEPGLYWCAHARWHGWLDHVRCGGGGFEGRTAPETPPQTAHQTHKTQPKA